MNPLQNLAPGVKIALAATLILAAVGVALWQLLNQPMYRPGKLSATTITTPANQPDSRNLWAVEEGIELWHFAEGEGRNVLIVHGGPCYPYREAWAGLEPLTDDFRFHYYDQRGCGRSTRPIDTLTAQNQYENIQTLENTLGIGAQLADIERIRHILGEEQLIIIGHSFGGFLASLYAAEFPEYVEALVLVAPADLLVMPPAHGGLFEVVGERLPPEMRAEYDAYLADYLSFEGIFEMNERELAAFNDEFARYYAAALDRPIVQQGEVGGWMVQAQYLSMGRRHDYRNALSNVTAPTLVIHGEDDLQPLAVAQMYRDALPDAELATVSGAAHFPFEEQPHAFADIVANLLMTVK
jgi:proline iminopeptidase